MSYFSISEKSKKTNICIIQRNTLAKAIVSHCFNYKERVIFILFCPIVINLEVSNKVFTSLKESNKGFLEF